MSSLRSRIIISILFIIFLIVSGSYLVIQDIQTGIIEGEFREKGFLLANNLASEVTDQLLVNDLVEMRKTIENAKNSYPDIEYIFVADSEGIILTHTFEGGFPKALLNNSNPLNIKREDVFDTERGVIHEFDAPLLQNIGYVHIGLSENRVRAQILEASRKLLLLAISATVLGGLFAYFLGRWLTAPILSLTEGAEMINKGILDRKIDIRTGDELNELARTFNEMAESLNQKMNELVKSKDRIEVAEKYLETLFDSIEDGIIVVNTDHKITKINRSLQKIMGWTQEQVLGRTCHEIIFASALSQSGEEECPINTLLRTKMPMRFIHEVQIKNKDKKILEINASLFSDEKGTADIILVIRDVTQQKQLEEEIIKRNRELTVLNEISKNISETFDLDKILPKILENLLKLTRMERAAIYLFDDKSGNFEPRIHIGGEEGNNKVEFLKSDKVLIVENLQELSTSRMDADKNKDNISLISVPLKSKDKVLGIITITGSRTRGFSGEESELFTAIGNQVGIAIENIAFYNNIKYLKEFNEEILNNVNLAIHVIDKEMNILAVNDQLIKLGRGKFRKGKIINRNLFEIFPFMKDRFLDKEYEHVLKTGEIFNSEEKTGYYDEIIYTSTTKIPIKDKNGNVEKIITVIKDISSQKKLEEELKDSYDELKLTYSKLQELYKLKDNFISNLSHELRTPLTSVIGYTELMLEDKLTNDQRHKAEIIFRNSNRLSRLINALLDTANIESNNFQLNRQTVVVNNIIASVVEDMNNLAKSKNISINIDVPDNLIIEGDLERLTQLFSNIVDNAIKYTIKGKIIIQAEMENENVHIKISDTGIGIPEDKLNLIFERFYQLDAQNTRKYSGTGLGLWISKNIVEAHGGKIWAESKNRGSTFHILLPKSVK